MGGELSVSLSFGGRIGGAAFFEGDGRQGQFEF
jgi:hypothetical protein